MGSNSQILQTLVYKSEHSMVINLFHCIPNPFMLPAHGYTHIAVKGLYGTAVWVLFTTRTRPPFSKDFCDNLKSLDNNRRRRLLEEHNFYSKCINLILILHAFRTTYDRQPELLIISY